MHALHERPLVPVLVQARERFHIMITIVSIYTTAKLVHGQEVHQLGKYQSSRIHRPFPPGYFPGLWPKIDFQVDNKIFVAIF